KETPVAAVNRDRLKNILLDLIRIDSHSRRERACAMRLKREMEQVGAACRFDNAAEKVRGEVGNLIARIEGTVPGAPALLICAHMDTVSPGEGVKPIVDGDVIRTDGSTV